jgi:hypothetical protein
VLEFLPRPGAWLATAPPGPWYGLLPESARQPTDELRLFPGVVPLALAGAAALRRRDPLVAAAGLAAAGLVLLSLRWGDWSAWRLVHRHVPGADGVRAVSRVWAAVLPLALVAGLVAAGRLLAGRRWGPVAAGLLLAAGVAEQVPWRGALPSFDADVWQRRVEAVRRRMAPGAVYYVGPAPGLTDYQGQLLAMWAGLRANAPVVNGYSGRYPAGYPDWTRPMTADELRRWLGPGAAGAVVWIDPGPAGAAAAP